MQTQSLNSTSPDLLLLKEVKLGNVKAFDLVFEKYYKNLCRFAYQFTHDDDMSQSLVQDVFIKFWEKRFALSNVENLTGYLSVMVKNCCVDHQKKNIKIELSGELQDNRTEDSTEQQVFSKNFEEQLISALARLPLRCREAFEYSRFENMSNKEIAKKLGISIKGVEALIGRSLRLLRVELHEFLPSSGLKNINPVLFLIRLKRLVKKITI